MRRCQLVFAALLVYVAAPAVPQGRQLSWDALSVRAHLDADGRLVIEETQAMVFTGDWNGGERRFDMRPRQDLELHGMSRRDPRTGIEVPMVQGSLDVVDRWSWSDRDVLRWRAREESDPPFDGTKITYVIRYALSSILQRRGDGFVLDHDFAFADRVGPIRHFRLDLTMDPEWQTSGGLQETWIVEGLPPGESVVLRVPLHYTGEGTPLVDEGIGSESRTMLAALLVLPLLFLAYALLREQLLGRLDRPRHEQISRAWLEQNLLRDRPEVIGAIWDDDVGAAEVSAVIARLTGAGLIESTIEDGQMQLRLLTREGLDDGYERALIDGLFFDGDSTNAELIRRHYADSGFAPSGIIAPGVKAAVQERLPAGNPVKPSWIVPTLSFLAAAAALAYMVKGNRDLWVAAVVGALGALVVGAFAALAPESWRRRKSLGVFSALAAMLPAFLVVGVVAFVVWLSAATGFPELSFEMRLALTALALWIFATAVHALRSRESREAIAFRKTVGAAREYFRRELRKEQPSLDDAWYPYVLAFGLSGDVDRWFRSVSGASSSSGEDHRGSASRPATGSSFSPSGWTGGGGSFGGAGAGRTWAAAAAGMAAGVAAPRSSSGGSSSSSGGGSSGGGGGGGW